MLGSVGTYPHCRRRLWVMGLAGGWACTSARTSPTPFLFFLIGWLGGHGLALDWGWV